LTKSNESDFQLKQTQDDLKQTQHILGQVKEKSEAEIKQIRQEHQVEISKLHVTLNRFNRAALKSAKRETDMRTKIAECKNKLAEAIELRDSFEQQVKDFEAEFIFL
jgi:chromosome segregation ATPase